HNSGVPRDDPDGYTGPAHSHGQVSLLGYGRSTDWIRRGGEVDFQITGNYHAGLSIRRQHCPFIGRAGYAESATVARSGNIRRNRRRRREDRYHRSAAGYPDAGWSRGNFNGHFTSQPGGQPGAADGALRLYFGGLLDVLFGISYFSSGSAMA